MSKPFPKETAAKPLPRETSQVVLARAGRAAEDLLQSNGQLRALLAASTQVAIIGTTTEGVIVVFNTGAERMLGYTSAEMTGKLTPMVFHLASEVIAQGAVMSAAYGQPIQGFDVFVEAARRGGYDEREWTYVHKDGHHLTVNLVVTAVRDSNGHVTGYLGVANDVTASGRVHAFQAQLAAIVDDSDDAIVSKSLDGLITSWNKGAARIFGYTAQEAIGQPMAMLFPPDRGQEEAQILARVRNGERIDHFVSVRRRKDGRDIDVSITLSPIRNSSGTLIGVSQIARDITVMQQMQRDLLLAKETTEAVNRELESFSYSVAHDLRSPLRSIDGFSQALLEDCGDTLDAAGRKYLGYVREAAQLMAQLIDEMLELSRVTRSELTRQQIDISALAEAAVERLQRQEPGRLVELVIQEGLTANGDPTLLAVVLANLLGNAWKFSGKREGARIEFGAVSQGGDLAYFVRDNGAGFDMAYAGKLFGVFQRLHSTTDFEGNGVGLATVQRIIHRHGGRVWAEGTVRAGATFYFTLGKDGGGA